MTAAEAIASLNARRLLIPAAEFPYLVQPIITAAIQNDHDAQCFLWLLNWKPQQLLN